MDNNNAPSGYDELIRVIAEVPTLVCHKRRAEGLSLRQAGEASGVHFVTLARIERGENAMRSDILTALLRWLGGGRMTDTSETYGLCTACGSVEVALVKVSGTRDLSDIGESPTYRTGYGCEVCA